MSADGPWTADEITLALPDLRRRAERAAETDDTIDVDGALLVGLLDRLDDAEAWVPQFDL